MLVRGVRGKPLAGGRSRFFCGAAFMPPGMHPRQFVDRMTAAMMAIGTKTGKAVMSLEMCPTTGRFHVQWALYRMEAMTHSAFAAAMVAKGVGGSHKFAGGTWDDQIHYVFKPTTKVTDEQMLAWDMKPTFKLHMWKNGVWATPDACQNAWVASVAQCDRAVCFCADHKQAPAVRPVRVITLEMLYAWQKSIIAVMDHLHKIQNDRVVVVVVDEAGCTGKSWLARFLSQNPTVAVSGNSKGKDLMYELANRFNTLEPHGKSKKRKGDVTDPVTMVVMDIARSDGLDTMPYVNAEQILNGSIVNSKYESSTTMLPHWVQCLILTNVEPTYSKLTADRWMVFTITSDRKLRYKPVTDVQQFWGATTIDCTQTFLSNMDKLGYRLNPVMGAGGGGASAPLSIRSPNPEDEEEEESE